MVRAIREQVDPREHPLFSGANPAAIRRFVEAGRMRDVPRGAALREQGATLPTLQLLLRGSARVARSTGEGAELMLALRRAPAVLGEAECVLGADERAEARALERCVVFDVDREAALAAIASCPRLAANFARDLASKLCSAEAKQFALAFEKVEARVAALLLEYADAYGLQVHEGTKIRVPLCQDELALSLGVARRSITRALKSWQEAGVLAKQSGCYVIRDPGRLRAVAAL